MLDTSEGAGYTRQSERTFYGTDPQDGEARRAVTPRAPANTCLGEEAQVSVPDSTAASAGGATLVPPIPQGVADLRDAYADVLLRDETCVHGVSFMLRCTDCDEAGE